MFAWVDTACVQTFRRHPLWRQDMIRWWHVHRARRVAKTFYTSKKPDGQNNERYISSGSQFPSKWKCDMKFVPMMVCQNFYIKFHVFHIFSHVKVISKIVHIINRRKQCWRWLSWNIFIGSFMIKEERCILVYKSFNLIFRMIFYFTRITHYDVTQDLRWWTLWSVILSVHRICSI